MSHPEQGGSNPEYEQPGLYVKAAGFSDETLAGQVYYYTQEAIFAAPCDLSCYRFMLDEMSYVAVLGSPPPAEVDEQLTALLAAGEPTPLPDDVVAMLQARRAQARQIGPWVEGHYQPGKRFRRQ
jgi:hypothetical protein